MQTSQNLKTIYDEASKKLGPSQARKYLTTFFSTMIFDLEESGDFSIESIDKKIAEEASFISKIRKEDVA